VRMPIYELRCEGGHPSESLQAASAPLPACPDCGAATRKVPSRFGVSGSARVPPPPERMPQTWKGTHRGNREYVTELRRTAEARRDLEAKHPELAGDRRPILAHEGRFEGAPLRAGDHHHGPGGKQS
jgi:putative FmdB family regulatory protein